MGIPIYGAVPDPARMADPIERESLAKALRYMDLEPGKPLLGIRSTWCSSEAAPIRASRICAPRPAC